MTGNNRTSTHDEPAGRAAADALDELLQALRSDQGGARTSALRRALAVETGERSPDDDDALAELASAVESLADRTDDLEASVSDLEDRLTTVDAATSALRTDLSAARERGSLDGSDDADDADDADDLARRVEHVEAKLDRRTTSLASEIAAVEDLDRRIEAVEAELDRRTDVLTSGLEEVDETLEKAVRFVHEDTRNEIEDALSSIEDDIDDIEREFGSSIDDLEDDVDTLEWHAADFTLWRQSVEDALADDAEFTPPDRSPDGD